MIRLKLTLPAALLIALYGCASAPSGPSITALPGTHRSTNDFNADNDACRQHATQQVNVEPNDQIAGGVVFGTLLGAALGAAFGGQDGAEVGAGVGLLFGSVAGADAAQHSAYSAQRQYDNAYIQCMYGRGHRVPATGALTQGRARGPVAPGPDANYPPPPPSGPPTSVPPDYFPPPPPPY